MTPRPMLSRQRIVDAAARVADRGGLPAVSMRTVAKELGVEAMSLYHHVASKDALLDSLADWVFDLIELPPIDATWREALSTKARSARAVLSKHPWGLGMIESRPTPGAPLLRHHDRILGCLDGAGFSAALATHAFAAIDAYVFGVALTEANLPFEAGEGAEAEFAATVAPSADEYPHIAANVHALLGEGSYSFADEFDYGLELLLDGIADRLKAERSG